MDYQRADDGGYRIRFEVVEWYSLTLVAISRAKARKYRSSAVHPDVASLQKELLERFNNVSDDFREDGELRIGTRQLAALHEILQPSRIHRHYGRARRILLAQMRAYVASLMRGESPEPLNSAWVRKEEEAAAEQDWGWRGWQVNASTLTKREAYIASWVLKALRLRDVAVLNPRKSFVQIFDVTPPHTSAPHCRIRTRCNWWHRWTPLSRRS